MMKKIFLLSAACAVLSLAFAQSDTALWLRNPAISPDGKTIAFSYMGDIFTVPYAGGDATRLTVHEAYESHPVWSPDSKQIAFASHRHGNADVFIMPATGGEPERLTFHSSDDRPYSFSPDGSEVLFGAVRLDDHRSVLFPSRVLPELYGAPVSGGRTRQILTTPAEDARYSADGKFIIYHDRKGYEDEYRKHHTSSVARDIWLYNTADDTHRMLTTDPHEDRNPVFSAGGNRYFFLSERGGSFNIWKADLAQAEGNPRQITFYEDHPVRSLTRSNESVLCYSYNGEIYTTLETDRPRKVTVRIRPDRRYNLTVPEKIDGKAGEFAVSPNGKEIAFITRGEVFVTSVEFGVTKRITDTPTQERNLHFNSDGTKLLYSGERDGSWNIYEASPARPGEKYFFNATLINETPIVATDAETFQGQYSPDDKEVAFFEERTTLRVKNLESGEVRTVLPGSYNYSYSDGDQYFTWSPDSKWLLVEFANKGRWQDQVGLVKASGDAAPQDLTQSGYGGSSPKFGMNGDVVCYLSSKDGFRSHGSWGTQSDVYALFLNENAYQRFKLSKADYALWKEMKKEKKKTADEEDGKKKKKKKDKDDTATAPKPLDIEWEDLDFRRVKLTEFSSFVSDFLLDSLGENLYYLARTDKGYNLWKTDFKEGKTEHLVTLNGSRSNLHFDKGEKHIFMNNGGSISKVAVKDGKKEAVSYSGEMNLNADEERAYMFEHAWRQTLKKFYVEDMHGVDWPAYRDNYARFLPHINNGHDFADMLSEMLGELNASHTGARFRESDPKGDQTAALGVFFDESHEGDGLLIADVMPRSPLIDKERKVKPGVIIEKIDGETVKAGAPYYPLLNRKAGQKVLLEYRNQENGNSWEDVVEPISLGAESNLAYHRWIEAREADVERWSDGKLGYVHVRGMNSPSFREVYSRALGRHNDKEGLIVDTRFNGGGWLHDDLATFLSGEPYMQFVPRGQENLGGEPLGKWQKPTAVVMSEGNYSDAHLFPYVYKFFEIGPLVGMPVPGTGTAVWWERMLDGTVFGIPQLGMRDVRTGELMENLQLEPDYRAPLLPGDAAAGKDTQLEKAVEVLKEKQ